MIITDKGRSKSQRTVGELRKLLADDLLRATPEEKVVLEEMIQQLVLDQRNETTGSLYSMLLDAEYSRPVVDIRTFILDKYYLGDSCQNTRPQIVNDLEELFSGGYLECVLTGCVDLDGLLMLASGELTTLRALLGEDRVAPALLGRPGGVVGMTSSTGPQHSGTRPTRKLELANGMRVYLTPEHKVMTQRGWVPAVELTPLDLVPIPRQIKTNPTEHILEDEARVVGYMSGDGCTDQYRARFVDGNEGTVADFVDSLRACRFDAVSVKRKNGAWEVCVAEATRSGFLRMMRRHGVWKEGSLVRKVSPLVCQSPDYVVAAYLHGLFSCEGTVVAKENTPPRIQLGLANERLIREIQLLLLRLGVHSRIRKVSSFHKKQQKRYAWWTLAVSAKPDIERFLQRVGLLAGKEEACRAVLTMVEPKTANTNTDVIPLSWAEMGVLLRQRGIVRPAGSRWWKWNDAHPGKLCSVQSIEAFCAEHESLSIAAELRTRFLSDNIRYERVRANEEGPEIEVGDIGVPDGNSFFIQGIQVHNSIGWGKSYAASIGVLYIIYEISCMRNPHESFGLSPGSDISVLAFAATYDQALSVIFEQITTKLVPSRYFQEHFKPQVLKDEIRFPLNVHIEPKASTDTSALGRNVISVIIDECLHGESLVLLAGGEGVPAQALFAQVGPGVAFQVETFDFERNRACTAEAYIKQSTTQECFELVLEGGFVLRASGTHLVAVQRQDHLVFILIRDIIDGERMVVYGTETAQRRNETEDFRGTEGSCAPRGAESETIRDHETEVGGGRVGLQSTPSEEGGGQSQLWARAYGRGEGVHRQRQSGSGLQCRDASEDARSASREEGTHRGVQAEACRTQPYQGFPTLRGVQAEDFNHQRLAPTAGRLSLSGPRRDGQEWQDRVPFYVGAAGVGGTGSRCDSGELRLRTASGGLRVGGEAPVDAARLSGYGPGGHDEACRGEASGLHGVSEGDSQDDGSAGVLRGARLGIRGVGRALTVARVLSKKALGVHPTYDISVPGYEVFVADGCLVHNSNFIGRGRKRKFGPGVNGSEVQAAEIIYNNLKRRMVSRFQDQGRLPGMFFIASSKQTVNDFTAKLIKGSIASPTLFVRDYSLWSLRRSSFSAETFAVLCGNEVVNSRILEADEVEHWKANLPDGAVIVEPPEDLRALFERDLEGAIRDVAGISTAAIYPYLRQRDKIESACLTSRKSPFSQLIYTLGIPGNTFLWHQMVTPSRGGMGAMNGPLKPLAYPSALRHVHYDMSLGRKDATGVCIACIAGWKQVDRIAPDGSKFSETAPIFFVDLVLKIVPQTGGEIDHGRVHAITHDFVKHGYPIVKISTDRYPGPFFLQSFANQGYDTETVSVDVTLDPYENLKLALYEDRVIMYRYDELISELQLLEMDWSRARVDHPVSGSKDVSDALAGCLWTLAKDAPQRPLMALRGNSQEEDPWMEEQQQAAFANQESRERYSPAPEGPTPVPTNNNIASTGFQSYPIGGRRPAQGPQIDLPVFGNSGQDDDQAWRSAGPPDDWWTR